MLHRFNGCEEAALFASRMRDQGHAAEVLHDHAASLWGPLAVGGVAVWVSDEEADGEPVIDAPRVSWLPGEISGVAGGVVLAVLALGGLVAGLPALREFAQSPGQWWGVVGHLLLIPLWVFGCSVPLAVVLGAWVHRFWDAAHPQHPLATRLHGLLAVLALLAATPVGALVFGLWLLWCGG